MTSNLFINSFPDCPLGIKDPNLPEGKRVVVEKGFPGWRGSSYKQKENEKPVVKAQPKVEEAKAEVKPVENN